MKDLFYIKHPDGRVSFNRTAANLFYLGLFIMVLVLISQQVVLHRQGVKIIRLQKNISFLKDIGQSKAKMQKIAKEQQIQKLELIVENLIKENNHNDKILDLLNILIGKGNEQSPGPGRVGTSKRGSKQ